MRPTAIAGRPGCRKEASGHVEDGHPDGELRIHQIIIDDIGAAQARGDVVRAARLKQTLRRFIEQHPGCKATG